MSPEAWGFFTILVTTQAKLMKDSRFLTRKSDPDVEDSNAKLLTENSEKLDELTELVREHIGDGAAHMPGPAAPVVRRHRRATDG